MKRASIYLSLVALVLGFAAIFGAGRHEAGSRGDATAALSVLPQGKGQPAPDKAPLRLSPARKSDRIERVSLPEFADRRISSIPVDEARTLLLDAPPSGKFLKGVFHRYRPRDPTVS